MGEKNCNNPILKRCQNLLDEVQDLHEQVYAQVQVHLQQQERIRTTRAQIRLCYMEISKEIAAEIFASDLRLSDEEYSFLIIPIKYGGDPDRTHISLLEDLIRRFYHRWYPPVDYYKSISLSRIYKAIGFTVRLERLFESLNRKFENILVFKIDLFVGSKDKIGIRVEMKK